MKELHTQTLFLENFTYIMRKKPILKILEGREIISPDNTQVINRNLSHDKEKNKVLVNSDIVLVMNSNGGKIDPNLLYPVEGSTSRKLYCDVEDLLKDCTFQNSPTVTTYNVGSVLRRLFSTAETVQYCGGIALVHVGDSISTVEAVQHCGEYHQYCGG